MIRLSLALDFLVFFSLSLAFGLALALSIFVSSPFFLNDLLLVWQIEIVIIILLFIQCNLVSLLRGQDSCL